MKSAREKKAVTDEVPIDSVSRDLRDMVRRTCCLSIFLKSHGLSLIYFSTIVGFESVSTKIAHIVFVVLGPC